jgi:hypothetical protein
MSSNVGMNTQNAVPIHQEIPKVEKKSAPTTKRNIAIGLVAISALAAITGISYTSVQRAINVPCDELSNVTLLQINHGVPIFGITEHR